MKRKIISLLLAALMCCSCIPSVFADDKTVSVKLTADEPTLSVTLPTSIPINLGSDGTVTCPSDLKIINNSAGPIQITSIKMTEDAESGWKLTDFNGGNRGILAGLSINSKKLGFGLTANGDTAATSTDGTQYLDYTDENWTVPGGTNMELPIGCAAVSGAVTSSATNEAAGTVTFTVGWKGVVVKYTVRSIEEVINEEGNAEVAVGDQVQLSAAAVYSLRVPTWESSDSSVVEVTPSGLATAKNPGSATVTYTFGDSSGSLQFNVSKKTVNAPAAPTMASNGGTSVTLNTVSGCEYSIDNTSWQDSPKFTALVPGTEYTFYQRYKETDASFASSSSSANFSTKPITGYTLRPIDEVTNEDGSVSLTVDEQVQLTATAVYSLSTPTWESSNSSVVSVSASGLASAVGGGTATVTYTNGRASGEIVFNIAKLAASAPAAPTMASNSGTSITLTTVDGCEYSMDNINWQNSPEFTGLTPETEYAFYQRYKETDRNYSSPSSSASLNSGRKSYLTFSSPSSFTLKTNNGAKNWDGTLEYSTNTITWTTWDGTTELASSGNVLYLRGTGNTVITGNSSNYKWVLTGSNIACSGNIETLLDYATVQAGNHPTMASYCYRYMFFGCTNLTTAPTLPATTLTPGCYEYMFWDCKSLNTAPALPATTLASNCYSGMFIGCKSLPTTPALPATTLATYCYRGMFEGCTSLTTAPALPATTLAEYCYSGMFHDCTNLTTAPELPATTLAGHCYGNMFWGCTRLTTAPALPATTLAFSCYDGMFQGCTSLITAPALPVTTLAKFCYSGMFHGCTSLTTAPALPATTLTIGCYKNMFYGCTSLKLSETKTGEYTQAYRVPASGSGTTANNALSFMFTDTGGTFTGTPTINTTYYLSNTNSIVS